MDSLNKELISRPLGTFRKSDRIWCCISCPMSCSTFDLCFCGENILIRVTPTIKERTIELKSDQCTSFYWGASMTDISLSSSAPRSDCWLPIRGRPVRLRKLKKFALENIASSLFISKSIYETFLCLSRKGILSVTLCLALMYSTKLFEILFHNPTMLQELKWAIFIATVK